MNNYEISIDVTPKDKFEKAEKDLIQALKSFSELNFQEQQQLVIKLFGVAQLDFATKFLRTQNID